MQAVGWLLAGADDPFSQLLKFLENHVPVVAELRKDLG